MNNFNSDSVHDEKMIKVKQLINSDVFLGQGQPNLLNEDELKGYIKALDWVMEEWE